MKQAVRVTHGKRHPVKQAVGVVHGKQKPFLARPVGTPIHKSRTFSTRGEAVSYLKRVAKLKERIG